MSEFKQYKRKGLSEMRPYVKGEDMTGIMISEADKQLFTLEGGMVARNPKNHDDKWYVAKKYFEDNLELAGNVDSTFIERLLTEKAELNVKIDKLIAFQNSEAFQKIEPIQKNLLNIQVKSMETYSQCLLERLHYLNK